MISGIGVDIVETARVERLLERHGDRFVSRVLTDDEFVEFERRGRSARFLASRFAAKEAVSKALGTGIGEAFGFQSVQVLPGPGGRPSLRFRGSGTALIEKRGIENAQISLSDEKHYVVAMVVLEC